MTETTGVAAKQTSRKRTGKTAGKAADTNKHGFYTPTFSAEEMRRLEAGPAGIQEEMNLLRVKILRLSKLTPLKKIDAKELETLVKLIRVVAVLDALERTGITARKVDATASPLLEALADMDPDDL